MPSCCGKHLTVKETCAYCSRVQEACLQRDLQTLVAEAAARLELRVPVAAHVAGVGHDDDVLEVGDGGGEHARVALRAARVAVPRQLHHLWQRTGK
jgi:hypothetical protein